jgi:hypothetical protein
MGSGIAARKLKRTEFLRMNEERQAKLRRRAEYSIKPDVRKTTSENERDGTSLGGLC